MGWFGQGGGGIGGRLTSRLTGAFLLRRMFRELRRMRVAAERQADALELLAGTSPRAATGGQTFRAYGPKEQHLSEAEVGQLSSVVYTSDGDFNLLLGIEDELRRVLGRDPNEQEVERAYQMSLGRRPG